MRPIVARAHRRAGRLLERAQGGRRRRWRQRRRRRRHDRGRPARSHAAFDRRHRLRRQHLHDAAPALLHRRQRRQRRLSAGAEPVVRRLRFPVRRPRRLRTGESRVLRAGRLRRVPSSRLLRRRRTRASCATRPPTARSSSAAPPARTLATAARTGSASAAVAASGSSSRGAAAPARRRAPTAAWRTRSRRRSRDRDRHVGDARQLAGERALAHLQAGAGALGRILHDVVAVGVVPAVEHELVLPLDALEQLVGDALVAGTARRPASNTGAARPASVPCASGVQTMRSLSPATVRKARTSVIQKRRSRSA